MNDPLPDVPVLFRGCDQPVAPLGIGTWSWGDKATWGMGDYDTSLTEATIAEAWTATLDAGVSLVDTAEVYGDGESERIIGRLLAADPTRRSSVLLATKFMPLPQKLNVGSAMRCSLEASLERLGVDRVDLYQIHGPVSLRSKRALANALADLVDDGLTAAVGVSNYSIREMESIHNALADRDVELASNQIEFSLLRRHPETSGLLAACRRLGVVPLGLLPHRPRSAHRQVHGRITAAGQAHVLQSPDGEGRAGGGRAAAHRRGPRPEPRPGGAAVDHREGRGAHPRSQER